jgi:hypothetical protein
MKQISGHVLVKETNLGIPDLIVAAYDCGRPIQESLRRGPDGKGLSLEDAGRRIGSVLTEPDGRFVLTSEDLEFQGNEQRPNLLVIVFAPEDVQGLDMPFPLPPEERILYISTVPRNDAGAEEAFTIRLLQTQLDHFDLKAGASLPDSSVDDHRLAASIEDSWNLGDQLRDRLKPRLREEQEKSEEFQSKARERVGNLSAIPKHLRNDGLTDTSMLIEGKTALADQLKPKQDQAVANGLDRMKSRNTVMHLRLTEDELRDLGLTLENGKVTGDIDPERLTAKIRAKTGGLDLVRKRGLDNAPPEELIKKYLLADQPVQIDGKNNLAEG